LEKDHVSERGRDAACFGVRLVHRLDEAGGAKVFVIARDHDDETPTGRTPVEKGGVLGKPDATEVPCKKQDGSDGSQYLTVGSSWVIVKVKIAGVLDFHILPYSIIFGS